MSGYLQVNGTNVKTPKKFVVGIQAIDGESGRNANGDMIRDYITTKRKLDLEWPPLTDSEISTLLKSVMSPFFQVTYPDPMEGKIITKTFYVGDRNSPTYSWNDKLPKWEGLSMNFIER
ncbi:DUF6711 family protein [Enterococcus sp. DIV0179]|uniref:DUF6711 family protein n=1 Tax=Enterococcus sp. DIV0179 TaxID=2774767 RepID=UPI003D2FC80F